MNDSLKDKNVIITEMMHGVGFEVALEFAKRGIHFLENIILKILVNQIYLRNK